MLSGGMDRNRNIHSIKPQLIVKKGWYNISTPTLLEYFYSLSHTYNARKRHGKKIGDAAISPNSSLSKANICFIPAQRRRNIKRQMKECNATAETEKRTAMLTFTSLISSQVWGGSNKASGLLVSVFKFKALKCTSKTYRFCVPRVFFYMFVKLVDC